MTSCVPLYTGTYTERDKDIRSWINAGVNEAKAMVALYAALPHASPAPTCTGAEKWLPEAPFALPESGLPIASGSYAALATRYEPSELFLYKIVATMAGVVDSELQQTSILGAVYTGALSSTAPSVCLVSHTVSVFWARVLLGNVRGV